MRNFRWGRLLRSATKRALGLVVLAPVLLCARAPEAFAQPQPPQASAPDATEVEVPAQSSDIPELRPAPGLGDLFGKPIVRVDVVTEGTRWPSLPVVTRVRAGMPLSPEAARVAMRELLESGKYARARVLAVPEGAGAVLRLYVLPRKVVVTIQVSGALLDVKQTLDAARVAEGTEITEPRLSEIASAIQHFYAAHGFPSARVQVSPADTDNIDEIVLRIEIRPGPAQTVARRIFVIEPHWDKEVGQLKQLYSVGQGARVDETLLSDADRVLVEALRKNGFLRALVNHVVKEEGGQAFLYVYVQSGPRIVAEFEGNRSFDSGELLKALSLDTAPETRVSELVLRVKDFYVARGFLDAEVAFRELGGPRDGVHSLIFTVREHGQVRVTKRVFPCLPKSIDPNKIGDEIQSFLEEDLPGANEFSTGDPNVVDTLFGPQQFAGARARPVRLNPATTYAPETYDRAVKHLRDLFRGQGYLNAIVGPVALVRQRCKKHSPGGGCVPEPFKEEIRARCLTDPSGLPLPEPPVPEVLSCRPDPARSDECVPELTLRIPIHLGEQTHLYDLDFEGNRAWSGKELARIANLEFGKPLSSVELEAARLRILDEYKNNGYAFAEVRSLVEFSPDQTRARARFVITERDQVLVRDFEVRGNVYTNTDLILARVVLRKDSPFRQDWARASEERLAALGTFTSVSVGLEDADVPQKEKRVVITVVEQLPQYLDPRIGFSTGEGLRFAFEYGNRNIGGRAIALTLRVQLNYLFDFIIFDNDVQANYATLSVLNRLERRNTVSIAFPELGLGSLLTVSVDGIDTRDNQRDFGLTKDALIPTVTYRPLRTLASQLSASFELNDARIFKCERTTTECGSVDYILGPLGVPEGRTFALGQRANFTWDGRDNPFAATKGLLVAAGVEHVNAFPSNVSGNRADIKSHFLRFTGRVAGYVPFGKGKTVLAMSLSGGYNFQLNETSRTYPDRLFYLGGVDSIRAFLADAVIPEDVAQRVLRGEARARDIVIRGGDLALNPRIELRLPITESLHTGLFFDTGNLWKDPSEFDALALRYTAGAGLRISTPIGPVAFDYGFNFLPRPWEDIGAFHFSIGLF